MPPIGDIVFALSVGIQRTVQEVRAGPTYSSNIEDQDVEVTTIPPPIPKPGPAGLDTTGKEFVFFDLETRGLEHTSHIIQIAAVHSTGQFSTYVIHEKKISLQASEITGVTVVSDSMLVKRQTLHWPKASGAYVMILCPSCVRA
ncbi:hypothetical protein DPMN_070054 [Dreissena polymorpha]|uniref:Exonuclease domain-containing protein n=1 Tax=Dreissena polymorpha TaxID=45954 RepID=A0A9D4BX47_DREPO|nr:hypothetical protein DPMN_070054 [Dreissena polymorpha]